MAVDERTRHELHRRLDRVLGVDEASTLMSHLPPTGWGDVVTREHLDLRLAETAARFDSVDHRFEQLMRRFDDHEQRMEHRFEQWAMSTTNELTAAFRGELNQAVVSQSRLLIVALFTALAAIAGMTLGVIQLAG